MALSKVSLKFDIIAWPRANNVPEGSLALYVLTVGRQTPLHDTGSYSTIRTGLGLFFFFFAKIVNNTFTICADGLHQINILKGFKDCM